MKINTLILDDNPNWQRIIGKFVGLNPLLNLVATCDSAMAAYAQMAEHQIDLLICDIEMPEFSGLDFVKSLRHAPAVIFVTSHRDFALDCYEVSPVDFLMKPLDPARFLKAIEKVAERLENAPENSPIEPYFFVKESANYVQIRYKEVLYMQGQSNYTNIVTTDKTYLPLLSIARLEEQLKGDVFIRVHRSYLVNRDAIDTIGKSHITLVNGFEIPIGDQYRSKINQKHVESFNVSR